MSAHSAVLEAATIRQQCKVLHLPTVAAQSAQLAEEAVRGRRTPRGFLEALLQAELEERAHRLAEGPGGRRPPPRAEATAEVAFARRPQHQQPPVHEPG